MRSTRASPEWSFVLGTTLKNRSVIASPEGGADEAIDPLGDAPPVDALGADDELPNPQAARIAAAPADKLARLNCRREMLGFTRDLLHVTAK
jgi:hypothetical protein